MTFEEYVARILKAPECLPDGWFIAKDNEVYAGFSNLYGYERNFPAMLVQGFTCTSREYRGRGIALALKLHAIKYAKEHSVPFIRTWNDSQNVAMLSLNRKLGFKERFAWITFARAIHTGTAV